MALVVLSLTDLLREYPDQENVKRLLLSFCTLKTDHAEGAEDVGTFLHEKAIQFEKMGIARTYLVMSQYRGESFMAGYFSISNKSFVIPKKNFQELPGALQRRLLGSGNKTQQANYEIRGFLLGQLGKNFSEVAKKARSATGTDLLALAYAKIQEAYRLVGGRIMYLECEDNVKIKDFYAINGFREILDYKSSNDLCIMVKKIEQ